MGETPLFVNLGFYVGLLASFACLIWLTVVSTGLATGGNRGSVDVSLRRIAAPAVAFGLAGSTMMLVVMYGDGSPLGTHLLWWTAFFVIFVSAGLASGAMMRGWTSWLSRVSERAGKRD